MGVQRAVQQAAQVGAEVALGRSILAGSRRALARRAGVTAATVGRVERGDPGVQLDTLIAVASAAGVDIVVRALPGRTTSLRDSGQLSLAQDLVGLAHASWRHRLEVPAGQYGRSADLVFLGPEEILHVEIERLAVDFQAQYRSAVAKREVLVARHDRPVRLVLVFADTARNRAAVRPHLPLIAGELPAGTRAVLAALRTGRPLGTDGLAWIRARPTRLAGSSIGTHRAGKRAGAASGRSIDRGEA
jgi:transcriptional regulator with XRE-family HTH domain